MRSVWITRSGPPEALEVRDGPDPVAGPGQVLIRVRASGVNFADVMARLGFYPDAPPRPCVVGYEVAGTVDRVGPGTDGDLAPGRRVVALTRFGGYAEAVAVPAAQVFPLPDPIGFEEAAAIPVNYLTAVLMLRYFGNVKRDSYKPSVISTVSRNSCVMLSTAALSSSGELPRCSNVC